MSAMLREAGLLKELAEANERIRQLEKERVPGGYVLAPGLDADELAALKRCIECWEDGDGHDVEIDMMRRLTSKGALHHRSGGFYVITTVGRAMLAAAPAPKEGE